MNKIMLYILAVLLFAGISLGIYFLFGLVFSSQEQPNIVVQVVSP